MPDTITKLIRGDSAVILPTINPCSIQCIIADPPYNTGRDFGHYQDKTKDWSSMMQPILTACHTLLTDTGSIWITIDSKHVHHLRCLLDDIFHPSNHVATIAWERSRGTGNDIKNGISCANDFIVVYRKTRSVILHRLPRESAHDKNYRYQDDKGRYQLTQLDTPRHTASCIYPITNPITGKQYMPTNGRSWRYNQQKMQSLIDADRVIFGITGNAGPAIKTYLDDTKGIVPSTWWPIESAGSNQQATKEWIKLFPNMQHRFMTPKPEKLIHRILSIATLPGETVLDPFLGSGTTCAVAHKMNRPSIGIDNGEHLLTLCVPRMEKVLDGEQGGISADVNWTGGGSFIVENRRVSE